MNYANVIFVFLTLTLSILCFCGLVLTDEGLKGGFSVQLIHRNSPQSPFYNPTETPFQQLHNALHRSINRVNNFYPKSKASQMTPQSEIIANGTDDYLMRYSIGTPPFEVMGFVDTGSDLVWLQCKPCEGCSNQTTPIFDPSKSSTYKPISCDSKECKSLLTLEGNSCHSKNDSNCQYGILYDDDSSSKGNLAFETLTFSSTTGSSVAFPKLAIGCDQARKFHSNMFGVVGLGKGGVSLITQMGPSIDFKFSYCLPYFKSKSPSKLNFGINAVVAGPGTVSTPLKPGPLDALYFLQLEGMSVGSKRIEFVGNSTSYDAYGNTLIDSGSTLTYLPEKFYAKLEPEVMAQIKLERVQSPEKLFSLCYKSPTNNETGVPFITAHFAGADVVLNPSSTFIEAKDNVICFTIVPMPIPGCIFGNLAQMNYLIGYDLVKKTVSFKPTDCTKM